MKHINLLLLSAVLFVAACNNDQSSGTDKKVTTENTGDKKAAPVLDSATKAANMMAYATPGAMHKMMAGEIEPAIIVGIGDDRMSLPEWVITRYPILSYDNVAYEDSFHVATLLRGAPVKLHSGDGASYYDAIKKEVIPFIEAHYKTNDDRGLTGHSLSSLFASHVLFKDPGYFSKIGINSAPLFVNNDETMHLEKAFYDAKKSLKGKVFISASSLEGKNLFEKRALNLANALKSRNYPGLTVKHHVFQDESHVSEIGALTGKILYFFYGLPVDRSLGRGHKADK